MTLSYRLWWLMPWIFLFTAIVVVSSLRGQERVQELPWRSWSMVLGDWVAGDGSSAQGTGTFSFSPDLQGTILVRKSHVDYPAMADRPAISHDDLTIVHREQDGRYRAIYFDNEGHVIRYAVDFSTDGTHITFLSDTTSPGPAFRLTYRSAGPDSLSITFAIAPSGSPRKFAPYLEGSAHRKR